MMLIVKLGTLLYLYASVNETVHVCILMFIYNDYLTEFSAIIIALQMSKT